MSVAAKQRISERLAFTENLLTRDGDPLAANLLICLLFFLAGLHRLGQPEILYFDEQWYVSAAVRLLTEREVINREHPMLGKELIALFYWMLGGSWVSLRLGSLIFGTVGLLGFQRAHFYLTRSARSTVLFGILVAGNCLYLTTSRIALLDPYMLGFAGIGLSFFAKGIRFEAHRTANFALAGAGFGAAMACKWTVAPLCMLVALATILKFRRDARQLLQHSIVAGAVAILVYAVSFIPILYAASHPLAISDLLPFQRAMALNLGLFIGENRFQSFWWEWVLGRGQMWILDPAINDSDRYIVLSQNPMSTLVVLPSIVVGLSLVWKEKSEAIFVSAISFLFLLMFWAIGHKPNLYLYHYNLPLIFGLSVVAQLGDRVAARGGGVSVGLATFAYIVAATIFYPIATGAAGGTLVHSTAKVYGWTRDPRADDPPKLVSNVDDLRKWATRCVHEPSRTECRRSRQTTISF